MDTCIMGAGGGAAAAASAAAAPGPNFPRTCVPVVTVQPCWLQHQHRRDGREHRQRGLPFIPLRRMRWGLLRARRRVCHLHPVPHWHDLRCRCYRHRGMHRLVRLGWDGACSRGLLLLLDPSTCKHQALTPASPLFAPPHHVQPRWHVPAEHGRDRADCCRAHHLHHVRPGQVPRWRCRPL